MTDRRLEYTDATPMSEDWRIFKNAIVSVKLHLTPLKRETSRGDLLYVGYQDDTRIEVVFAGRRREMAQALELELGHFLKAENAAALSKGRALPHAATLRFPLHVEGAWRTRLAEVGDDEWERIYQFMAARWSFNDHRGVDQVSGDAPVKRPITRMPAF